MQRRVWSVAVIVLAAACGGDETGDAGGGDEEFTEALGTGAASGVLVLNGAEIPLTSATCVLDDDTFDSGAVGPDGLRVFASQNNPLNPVSAQILDAELIQWFPREVQGDEAARDGGTITSPTHTYFNDQDDLTLEASFTIECP